MEWSMLARHVNWLLTANVSFLTLLCLCPPLLPDKTRIIMDVPKDSLVNIYNKLSSRYSQQDFGTVSMGSRYMVSTNVSGASESGRTLE